MFRSDPHPHPHRAAARLPAAILVLAAFIIPGRTALAVDVIDSKTMNAITTNGARAHVLYVTTPTTSTGAGHFEIVASGSGLTALESYTNGSGIALFGNNTSTGGGIAVEGCSYKGIAGFFQITNNANTSNSVSATTNGGGAAVYATNSTTASGRAGDFEITNSGNTGYAMYVTTNGTGSGLFSYHTGSPTLGTAAAVWGEATGAANGVSGIVDAAGSGNAFTGTNAGTSGAVGHFETTNSSNAVSTVFGKTVGTGHAGDFEINNTMSTSDALFASTNGTGNAGWFAGPVHVVGNVSITGSISKGSGTFEIDHPLDPANRFLRHSFVESPDMKDVYDGVITTDATGNATVTLEPYFESLNQDFRYQATCLGQFANVIVSREISNNSFDLRTDKPNVKVSWQVTGIRHDAYANAHRIVPESDKSPEEKGRYLYPVEQGQPITLGIDYARQMGIIGPASMSQAAPPTQGTSPSASAAPSSQPAARRPGVLRIIRPGTVR